MAETKPILLSGVKPTGRPHIGNYFGALRQFVDMQEQYAAHIFVADYHALTTLHDAEALKQAAFDVAVDYLAVGLDPKKTVLFKQSAVPAHTELAWIFNCITTMGYLERGHAYKDAQAKNADISVGVFDYPLLMAADILLYDTDVVPVGQDQKQHLEFARDTAEKFNRIFGETFKLPEPLILDDVAVVPGIDGQKMSKSYGNTIPLFAEDAEIEKVVMSIVTDSKAPEEPKDPETCTLFALHKLVSGDALPQLRERYEAGSISYKESKELLIENLKAFIAPLRERRYEIAANPESVHETLAHGAEIAREKSAQKMKIVRKRIGVV